MDASRFFLDTAYVLALLNPNDLYHKQAKALLPSMRVAHEVWITEAVLVEIGNALARSNRSAVVAFINSCYVTSNVRVVSVDSVLLRRAIHFYHSRGDKEWGLTDCISFIVMEDHSLTKALTTDEHFQQAGFRALLRDETT
ncbi:MAG: type II toxin-antitoxin system VapC family toxin [Methanophagales archaeon]|nr:type II toxin-antitoxin system VapC family toxin [Methanophagales archaeon]